MVSMATLIGLVMRLESPTSAEHVLFFFTDGCDCVLFVLDVVVAMVVVVAVVIVMVVGVSTLVVGSAVVAADVVEDGEVVVNFLFDLVLCATLFVRLKIVRINSK